MGKGRELRPRLLRKQSSLLSKENPEHLLWGQVAKHNTSLHSYSVKHFLPELTCFGIRNSRNIVPLGTSARKQNCLLSKENDHTASCVVIFFTDVPRTGLEPARDCSHIPLKDACLPNFTTWAYLLSKPSHFKDFFSFCKFIGTEKMKKVGRLLFRAFAQ